MEISLTLADVPPSVAISVAAIGLVGVLFGSVGALLVQRYLSAVSRIRDRYAQLRDSYARFASCAHSYYSICRAHRINAIAQAKVARQLSDVASQRIASRGLENAGLDLLEKAGHGDIEYRREMSTRLNDRMADTAAELHEMYVRSYMLERTADRRADLRSWYDKAHKASKAFGIATEEQTQEDKAIFDACLGGIDDWLAEVAIRFDREEDTAREECITLFPD